MSETPTFNANPDPKDLLDIIEEQPNLIGSLRLALEPLRTHTNIGDPEEWQSITASVLRSLLERFRVVLEQGMVPIRPGLELPLGFVALQRTIARRSREEPPASPQVQ